MTKNKEVIKGLPEALRALRGLRITRWGLCKIWQTKRFMWVACRKGLVVGVAGDRLRVVFDGAPDRVETVCPKGDATYADAQSGRVRWDARRNGPEGYEEVLGGD